MSLHINLGDTNIQAVALAKIGWRPGEEGSVHPAEGEGACRGAGSGPARRRAHADTRRFAGASDSVRGRGPAVPSGENRDQSGLFLQFLNVQ